MVLLGVGRAVVDLPQRATLRQGSENSHFWGTGTFPRERAWTLSRGPSLNVPSVQHPGSARKEQSSPRSRSFPQFGNILGHLKFKGGKEEMEVEGTPNVTTPPPVTLKL